VSSQRLKQKDFGAPERLKVESLMKNETELSLRIEVNPKGDNFYSKNEENQESKGKNGSVKTEKIKKKKLG
jgi:hypothetical protein